MLLIADAPDNEIGNKGATTLAQALKKMSSLEKLDLSSELSIVCGSGYILQEGRAEEIGLLDCRAFSCYVGKVNLLAKRLDLPNICYTTVS